MLGEAAGDGAGLDQHDMDAAAAQLKPQRIAQAFDGELRGIVGAPPLHGDKSEDGGILHDAARAIGPHQRQAGARQLMPAKHIGLELGLQHLAAQILDRARLAIGAIVEQPVELAAGAL